MPSTCPRCLHTRLVPARGPARPGTRALLGLLGLVGLLGAPALQAQEQPVQPLRFTLGAEQLRLPADEGMGLVGASVLFDLGGGRWWLGPAVYGAATGQRGGFYVGGVELQRTWLLGRSTAVAAGLFAGGGGGAAAPVGGGLMLRPALTLWQDLGPLQAGLGVSEVRFPSGDIASRQWGLLLGWTERFTHAAPGGPAPPGRSGIGFDRMALVGTQLQVGATGGRAERRIGLVGVRAERDLGRATQGAAFGRAGDGWVAGFEAAAAARGDAAGYMEILGHLGFLATPLPRELPALRVGLRGALGLGGGGAMPMGGGLFGKATLAAAWQPLPGWTLGADLGVARGDPLRARSAQLWLAADLEGAARTPGQPGQARPLVRTEWVATLQRHTRTARVVGATPRPLDAIGLELNRYLGEHLYLSGQAHSAYAGGAGAYSIGLLGAGVASAAGRPWRVGAELLAGAAGGGGVATGGGGVLQARAWAGWAVTPEHELRLVLGGMRSQSGQLSTPVAGLAWSRRFLLGG